MKKFKMEQIGEIKEYLNDLGIKCSTDREYLLEYKILLMNKEMDIEIYEDFMNEDFDMKIQEQQRIIEDKIFNKIEDETKDEVVVITYLNKKISNVIGYSNFLKSVDERLEYAKDLLNYELDKLDIKEIAFGYNNSIALSLASNFIEVSETIYNDLIHENPLNREEYHDLMRTNKVNNLIDIINKLIRYIDEYNIVNQRNEDRFKIKVKRGNK